MSTSIARCLKTSQTIECIFWPISTSVVFGSKPMLQTRSLRCFEQNDCGGLFTAHEEGTGRSELGACAFFSDVSSWKVHQHHLGHLGGFMTFNDMIQWDIYMPPICLRTLADKGYYPPGAEQLGCWCLNTDYWPTRWRIWRWRRLWDFWQWPRGGDGRDGHQEEGERKFAEICLPRRFLLPQATFLSSLWTLSDISPICLLSVHILLLPFIILEKLNRQSVPSI